MSSASASGGGGGGGGIFSAALCWSQLVSPKLLFLSEFLFVDFSSTSSRINSTSSAEVQGNCCSSDILLRGSDCSVFSKDGLASYLGDSS